MHGRKFVRFLRPRVVPAFVKTRPAETVPDTTDPVATVDSLRSVLEDEAAWTYLRSGPFRFIGQKHPFWGFMVLILAIVVPPLSFAFIDLFLPLRNWVLAFVILGNTLIFLGILGVAHAIGWKNGVPAFKSCASYLDLVGIGMLIAGLSALHITFRAMVDGHEVHRHSVIAMWLIWAVFVFLLAGNIRSVGRTVAGLYKRQSERAEKGWIKPLDPYADTDQPTTQENKQDELPDR